MDNAFYTNLKWTIHRILFQWRRLKSRNEDWIMGRFACMGKDVFNLLNVDIPLHNVQKGRVDYLNKTLDTSYQKCKSIQVVPFIERDDIKGLIFQQELRYKNLKKAPMALYMDSYSELTDQIFMDRIKNWCFCANYSDINHNSDFKNQFETIGLLPVDNLKREYRLFFKSFREKYNSAPIIFLHFPVKLDKREKFHIRYKKIKEAIDELQTEFEPFYSFSADEKIVDWPEEKIPGLENFPYHYNKATYQNIAEQIKVSGVFANFKNKI